MLDILKLLASFVTGGVAGALLTEWFKRKREGVQRVQLIERVNRLVSPNLEGFTLARIVHEPGMPVSQLQTVKSLRQYQLTMRNATSVHLQGVEVQFEFPAEEVSAWCSRPTLSKTSLESINANATTPFQTAYRWKIPHFPSGDSVEFTFQAVEPQSDEYEAALYNTAGVVLERIVGEPPPTERNRRTLAFNIGLTASLSLVGVLLFFIIQRATVHHPETFTSTVKAAGCDLQVVSYMKPPRLRGEPWLVRNRVMNVGNMNCVVQSMPLMLENPVTIKVASFVERERFSETAPSLSDIDLSVGVAGDSLSPATAKIYLER
jgi:hypothetical protein